MFGFFYKLIQLAYSLSFFSSILPCYLNSKNSNSYACVCALILKSDNSYLIIWVFAREHFLYVYYQWEKSDHLDCNSWLTSMLKRSNTIAVLRMFKFGQIQEMHGEFTFSIFFQLLHFVEFWYDEHELQTCIVSLFTYVATFHALWRKIFM